MRHKGEEKWDKSDQLQLYRISDPPSDSSSSQGSWKKTASSFFSLFKSKEQNSYSSSDLSTEVYEVIPIREGYYHSENRYSSQKKQSFGSSPPNGSATTKIIDKIGIQEAKVSLSGKLYWKLVFFCSTVAFFYSFGKHFALGSAHARQARKKEPYFANVMKRQIEILETLAAEEAKKAKEKSKKNSKILKKVAEDPKAVVEKTTKDVQISKKTT